MYVEICFVSIVELIRCISDVSFLSFTFKTFFYFIVLNIEIKKLLIDNSLNNSILPIIFFLLLHLICDLIVMLTRSYYDVKCKDDQS